MAFISDKQVGQQVAGQGAKALINLLNPKKLPANLATAVGQTGKLLKALPKPAPQPIVPQKPMAPKEAVVKGITEAGVNAASGFATGTGNLINTAGKLLNQTNPQNLGARIMGNPEPVDYTQITEPIKAGADWIAKQPLEVLEKTGGYNPKSISAGIGHILGIIASQVPTTVASGGATNAFMKQIPQNVQKLHPLASYLGANVASSPIGTIGAVGASEGRLPTGQELFTGAAIDLATSATAYGLKKLSGMMYRWANNPDMMSNKRIQGAAEEAASGGPIGGLTGNRNKIIAKVDAVMPKVGEARKIALGGIKQKFNRKELINDLVDEATKLENLGEFDDAAALMKKVETFRKTGKEYVSATELQQLIEDARDTILTPLKAAAKQGKSLESVVATPSQIFWEKVYDKGTDLLETASPDYALANRQFTTLYGVKQGALNGLKTPIKGGGLNPLSLLANAPSTITRGAGAISKVGQVIGGAASQFLKQPETGTGNKLTQATQNFLNWTSTPQ